MRMGAHYVDSNLRVNQGPTLIVFTVLKPEVMYTFKYRNSPLKSVFLGVRIRNIICGECGHIVSALSTH